MKLSHKDKMIILTSVMAWLLLTLLWLVSDLASYITEVQVKNQIIDK